MFDVRNNRANAVSAELTNPFGDKVFRTIVPRNVRLAEAPSHGQSIVGYDRGSRGSVAYLGLAGELMRRQREREKGQRGKEKTQEPASMANPAWAPRRPPRNAASGAAWQRCSGPRARPTPRRWKPADRKRARLNSRH